MPLGHRSLSHWYLQLGRQLEAGLRLANAVRSSPGALPGDAAETMARVVEHGGSVDSAWQSVGAWVPAADRRMLVAAAEAGRMPRMLHRLAESHAARAAAQLRLLLACLYPIGMLHLGALLLPLAGMLDWEKGFQWNGAAYARTLLLTLGPLWLLAGAIVALARRQSPMLARIVGVMPFFGRQAREQALADLAFTLGTFVEAGVRIDHAWHLAGETSTRAELRHAAVRVATVAARGERPSPAVAAAAVFPADFVALYRTGEDTGQLDHLLLQAAAAAQDRAHRALSVAMLAYPGAVFLVVAVLIIAHVIRFYSGYFRMIEKLAG